MRNARSRPGSVAVSRSASRSLRARLELHSRSAWPPQSNERTLSVGRQDLSHTDSPETSGTARKRGRFRRTRERSSSPTSRDPGGNPERPTNTGKASPLRNQGRCGRPACAAVNPGPETAVGIHARSIPATASTEIVRAQRKARCTYRHDAPSMRSCVPRSKRHPQRIVGLTRYRETRRTVDGHRIDLQRSLGRYGHCQGANALAFRSICIRSLTWICLHDLGQVGAQCGAR